ncbi:MAG: hypothetical protein FWD44_02845 [Oscillospiraceae bacterium]|nr:hypothetical protein [Oscillospiraceae bacterium]
MACRNLQNGECRRTGSSCNANEWECPIAKQERRDAFVDSRSGGGGGWFGPFIVVCVILALIGGLGSCFGCF